MRKLEIEEKELQPYLKNDTLTGRVLALLEHQKVNWSTAKENYNVLYNLKKKEFVIDGSKIIIQNNPHRLINTTAKVDEESVENRDCFLCIENLPAEQGAVKYYKEYYILVNPYPIFDKHFTIIKTKHIEQSILKYLNDMLLLSRDLGEELAVFYNGPKCGASAPDHLHFQAVPKTSLPVYENFVLNNFSGARLLGENKKLKAELILSAERYFVKLTSNDSIEIMNMFSVIYSDLTKIRRSTEEPMMNLLSFYDNKEWTFLIMLRKKHRPSFYFKEGDKAIKISPAAVDLSGVVVVPREEDFGKVNEEIIKTIFREVTITKEIMEYLSIKMKEFLI